MSRLAAPVWDVRPAIRLDRDNPFLLLQQVLLFVWNHDRSLHFFIDCLGFNLALDHRNEKGDRWVIVAPPDGTARICLIVPPSQSDEYPLIGKGAKYGLPYRKYRKEIPRMERAWRALSSSAARGSVGKCVHTV